RRPVGRAAGDGPAGDRAGAADRAGARRRALPLRARRRERRARGGPRGHGGTGKVSMREGRPEPDRGPEADTGTASADAYRRTAGFGSCGVGRTGLITCAYFLIASHTLDRFDYGQITVLWSAIIITVSTLYRPVDQLLSRHVAEHLEKGQSIRQPAVVAAK